jgi:hypothetical protein
MAVFSSKNSDFLASVIKKFSRRNGHKKVPTLLRGCFSKASFLLPGISQSCDSADGFFW